MVLDDFAAFVVNWDRKDHNILKISKQLNLGLDSLVFIDDNAAERQIVQEALPAVSVPEVGSHNILSFINYLDKNLYFENHQPLGGKI